MAAEVWGIWLTNDVGSSHWLPPNDDAQCDVAMVFRTQADAEKEMARQITMYNLAEDCVCEVRPFDWSAQAAPTQAKAG